MPKEKRASKGVDFFPGKMARVLQVAKTDGLSGSIRKLRADISYNLNEKWGFIYFERDLTDNLNDLLHAPKELTVRRARLEDIEKIRSDMYPYFGKDQEYDKRYIENLGEANFECFVAEKDLKLVNYRIVFKSAISSPLIKTPFDKKKVREKDAYLHSTFTVPSARGTWASLHTLPSVLSYLKKEVNARRALCLVHENAPGAVNFYRRCGFSVIEDPYPKRLWPRLLTRN